MAEEYKRFGDYIVYIDNDEVTDVFHDPDSELEDLKISDIGLPIDHDSYRYIRGNDVVVVTDENDTVLNVLTDQDPELGSEMNPLDSMEITEPSSDEDIMEITEPSSDEDIDKLW